MDGPLMTCQAHTCEFENLQDSQFFVELMTNKLEKDYFMTTIWH